VVKSNQVGTVMQQSINDAKPSENGVSFNILPVWVERSKWQSSLIPSFDGQHASQ